MAHRKPCGSVGDASLLTLAAISLHRYTALLFHLKYQQTVTTRRVCIVLAFIWALPLLLALISLLNRRELWHAGMATGAAVTLLVISVACIKIVRCLRAQNIAPDQAQRHSANRLNIVRYSRSASAMMWVYVLLIICYLPVSCMTALRSVSERTALTEYLYEFQLLARSAEFFLESFRLLLEAA